MSALDARTGDLGRAKHWVIGMQKTCTVPLAAHVPRRLLMCLDNDE